MSDPAQTARRAELLDLKFRLRCEQSLSFFFSEVVWKIVEQDRELHWNWAIPLLCTNAERVMQGTPNRWIVNCSVRTGKSLILSVALPIWYWLLHPSCKFSFYSYSAALRRELGGKREKVLRSELFAKYWGDRVSLPVRTSLENLKNNQGGEFLLLGPGATGHGADALIVDDPSSGRQARFENQLETQEVHVKEVIFSRLNNTAGPIVVVMQRQSPEDLSGTLSSEQGWHSTVIPPIFEEAAKIEVFDGTVLSIAKGTLVDPKRFSAENLDEMRRRMGSRAFSAGVLQKPPAAEEIVKAEWLVPYDYSAGNWRSLMDSVFISADTASVGTTGHSQWSVQTWGVKHYRRTRLVGGIQQSEHCNGFFLLGRVTRHMEYSEARRIIITLSKTGSADGVWIESATHGIPLAQELTKAGVLGVRLININKDGKKYNRLWAATSAMEDSRVYYPLTEWGEAWKANLVRCTKKLNERDMAWDDADSTSMFLNEAMRSAGLSMVGRMSQWAQLESIAGIAPQTDKLLPLGELPFTPKGYVHDWELKRAAQILLPQNCDEVMYGMVAPNGEVWDVDETESKKLLQEGWHYENQTREQNSDRT
jgi:phage terminase large subunit-like protein